MDRENVNFDDRCLDELANYAKDLNKLESVREYLRDINFSASNYEYEQIKAQLDRFVGPSVKPFVWNNNYKKAKAVLMKEVRGWRLKQLKYTGNSSMETVIPRRDTHAGFSYILTGKKTKGEYLEDVFQNYVTEERLARERGTFAKPILIGSRTQASGAFTDEGEYTYQYKKKTRFVSMVDIYQIFGELKFAKPMQFMLGQRSWYAGGKDDPAIHNRLWSWKERYSNWITLDYSNYDQTISDWLIREAFDVIREAFLLGEGNSFDEELFVIVREDFINKCFVDGDLQLVEAHKGVPSGSMFTQIVGSIVNRLMIETYLFSKGMDQHDMMIMGDDNIIFTNNEVDKKDLASYIRHNFGITVNDDKSAQATTKQNPEFLSREWRYLGVYREPNVLISKMLYPERFRVYDEELLDPKMIIHSYMLTFPLGMKEIIDVNKFESDYTREVKGRGRDFNTKWMSGLMRYRALYLLT
jgi:hypothetical protein